MTDYTPHRNLPYPEGQDQVAVHTDVRALAMKADTEMEHLQHTIISRAYDVAEAEAPPRVPYNLVNMANTIAGTMSTGGTVLDHERNRVTPFIPVRPNQEYVSRSTRTYHRIVWFDATRANITGTHTDLIPIDEEHQWVSPPQAVYARVLIVVGQGVDYRDVEMIFNRGHLLVDPTDEQAYPSSGYWNDREQPRVTNLDIDSLAFAADGKIEATYVEGAVPERISNLFDPDLTVPGSISPVGTVHDHSSNRVSDFMPVRPGRPYVSYAPSGVHRMVWFDATQTAISGTDTAYQDIGSVVQWTAPPGAAFARLGASLGQGVTMHGITFNAGTELYDPERPVSTGWWDDREQPPGNLDPETVRDLVDSMLPQWEPSTPTLDLQTIHIGNDRPMWLTNDGATIYGRRGSTLIKSTDDWETRETIHQFPSFIMGVRALNDGELLVTTHRDDPNNIRAKVYKSTGYDPDNPTAATWGEVHEAVSASANINNEWGLQVYQNILIVGEYGLRGDEGSRRVWMSEDHGDTYTLVFDLKTVNAPGRPEWDDQAHLHTAAWDPYWNRLWVIVGDATNTATYYSDDKGGTWTFVEGSNTVQYTGIMPLPDTVLFGSDRNPNGVHVYRRGQKTDMPIIKPLLVIDDATRLTRVFMLPFKRDWAPTTPTYFAAQPSGSTQPGSVIVATVDGRKAHLMWEGNRPDSGLPLSGNVPVALGPTAQGNVIAAMGSDVNAPDGRVLRATAPTWTRA